eukprot:15895187-Heterocapsa_arctica.AAC.1
MVNWLRQTEGGLHPSTDDDLQEYYVHTGQEFVYDGIKRARQQAWERCAKNKPNHKGVERGVDEHSTRKFYQKLVQKEPMKAGALHTILTDGIWTPKRVHKL